jgi:hypothetical protein
VKLKALKKFETKEYELSRVIAWIKEFLDQFTENQFIKGQYLEIAVTTSGVSTNHGLNETPSGWILTDMTSNSTVWRTGWTEKNITLQSSANTTVKVWVF